MLFSSGMFILPATPGAHPVRVRRVLARVRENLACRHCGLTEAPKVKRIDLILMGVLPFSDQMQHSVLLLLVLDFQYVRFIPVIATTRS